MIACLFVVFLFFFSYFASSIRRIFCSFIAHTVFSSRIQCVATLLRPLLSHSFVRMAFAKQVNVNIASVIMHHNNESVDLSYHIWIVLNIGRLQLLPFYCCCMFDVCFSLYLSVFLFLLNARTCLRANRIQIPLCISSFGCLNTSMSFRFELITHHTQKNDSLSLLSKLFLYKREKSINLRKMLKNAHCFSDSFFSLCTPFL